MRRFREGGGGGDGRVGGGAGGAGGRSTARGPGNSLGVRG